MCKIHAITYEALMEDEESQVRGFVHFADGGGVSFPHLTLFTPREAVRIVKNGEVCIITQSGKKKKLYYLYMHISCYYEIY